MPAGEGGAQAYTIYAASALQQRASYELLFILFGKYHGSALITKQKGPLAAASGPWRHGSNLGSVARAPFVVQTDAHDVIGHVAVKGCGDAGERQGDGLLQLAEIDIEILDFRAPAASKGSFDAGAGRPPGLHVVDGCRGHRPEAGYGGGIAVLDLPKSDATRSVQQEIGSRQDAKTWARGTEPLELVVGGEGCGRKPQDLEGRATFLAGGLNIGFQPEDPCAELIVVAGLRAADDAVHVLGLGGSDAEASQSAVVLRLAPAVADVAAPIDARPAVDGDGRRRCIDRPRRHVRSPRGSRRKHNKSGRSKEEFFHRKSPFRSSTRFDKPLL